MKVNVTIVEELKQTVQVEADNIADALEKVKDDYINGHFQLSYGDYADTRFEAVEVGEDERQETSECY